jgi:hypothetical protein
VSVAYDKICDYCDSWSIPTLSDRNAPDVRERNPADVFFRFFCLRFHSPPDLSLTSGAEIRLTSESCKVDDMHDPPTSRGDCDNV